MGLFSRHKNIENSTSDSKTVEKSAKNGESETMTNPIGMVNLSEAPKVNIPPMGTLSSPPMPKVSNSLDEVKNEVSKSSQDDNDAKLESSNQNNKNLNSEILNKENSNLVEQTNNGDDESLFDFSGSDLFGDSDTQMQNFSQGENEILENSQVLTKNSSLNNENSFEDSTIDTHMNSSKALSFESGENSFNRKNNENFFMTTQQFKSMLELLEQVKTRVKNSTDRHLRLLDIKSEEDVEYENLRRDFQFVEDKLYELDSVIFNK